MRLHRRNQKRTKDISAFTACMIICQYYASINKRILLQKNTPANKIVSVFFDVIYFLLSTTALDSQ